MHWEVVGFTFSYKDLCEEYVNYTGRDRILMDSRKDDVKVWVRSDKFADTILLILRVRVDPFLVRNLAESGGI